MSVLAESPWRGFPGNVSPQQQRSMLNCDAFFAIPCNFTTTESGAGEFLRTMGNALLSCRVRVERCGRWSKHTTREPDLSNPLLRRRDLSISDNAIINSIWDTKAWKTSEPLAESRRSEIWERLQSGVQEVEAAIRHARDIVPKVGSGESAVGGNGDGAGRRLLDEINEIGRGGEI